MAFRFNTATAGNIAAFAEDHRVAPTPTGCHLTWITATKPAGLTGRLGLIAGAPVIGPPFQRFLHNLRRDTDERFATR